MKEYRITKYDPKNRNDKGHYLYDHWTDISDVGRILEGELVTEEEYLKVEENYINAVIEILKDSKQDYLRLVGYNHKTYVSSINENYGKWYHEKKIEEVKLHEDKKIFLDEIPTIIKLNLRTYINTTLAIKGKFYVHFGYDFYMYVGTPNLSTAILNKLNSTLIFVENFKSPYYSPKLEYTVQISEKDSDYVDDEIGLDSTSAKKNKRHI